MEEIKERAPRRPDGGVGCETYCRQSDRREGEGLGGEEGIRYVSARRSESREKRRHMGADETR